MRYGVSERVFIVQTHICQIPHKSVTNLGIGFPFDINNTSTCEQKLELTRCVPSEKKTLENIGVSEVAYTRKSSLQEYGFETDLMKRRVVIESLYC